MNKKDNFNKLIGFIENDEFLPKDFDKFDSKEKLRQLFLNLSNNILKEVCFFNKYEQKFLSSYLLKYAFEYKIKNLLPISYLKPFKLKSLNFRLCVKSTLLINNYLERNINNCLILSDKNLLPIAKLILFCFKDNFTQLLIDKNLLFHEFVLEKIKKLHSDKKVYDLGNAICIKYKGFKGIKIYTSWKNIEVKKPNIKDELESAVKSIKSGEYYQIYLAYPKNNQFRRQIPVFVDELRNKEYQIKAIPYSFRSIIK